MHSLAGRQMADGCASRGAGLSSECLLSCLAVRAARVYLDAPLRTGPRPAFLAAAQAELRLALCPGGEPDLRQMARICAASGEQEPQRALEQLQVRRGPRGQSRVASLTPRAPDRRAPAGAGRAHGAAVPAAVARAAGRRGRAGRAARRVPHAAALPALPHALRPAAQLWWTTSTSWRESTRWWSRRTR